MRNTSIVCLISMISTPRFVSQGRDEIAIARRQTCFALPIQLLAQWT